MHPYTKSFLTASLLAATIFGVSIGFIAPNIRTPVVGAPAARETRNLVHPAGDRFHLENRDGGVRIRTHDKGAAEIRAQIQVYTRASGLEDLARDYVSGLLALIEEDGGLRLVSEPEDRPEGLDVFVDYDILLPRGVHVAVHNANGNVRIGPGVGDADIHGRNTDIEVLDPEGAVVAESTNGRIRVLGAPQGARLDTVNGNIYAHMTGGSLRANTTNGAIVARMLTDAVADCELISQNGGITVVLPPNPSAAVEARTARGTVRSDLPVDGDEEQGRRRQLSGTIGDGEARVSMDTLNGNIWIARSGT